MAAIGNNKPQLIQRFHSGAKQSLCFAFHSFTVRTNICAPHTTTLLLASFTLIRVACVHRSHVVTRATTDTMAALMRHGLFKIRDENSLKNLVRFYAVKQKKPNPDRRLPPKIDSTAESLAAKGFLRPHKPYTPTGNVQNQFQAICQRILGSDSSNEEIKEKKFELLTACQKEFNHSVPNSLLHTMQTTNDVLNFYQTPVNTTVPLDMMKNMDLPENLHIQYDYHRFHPETDTMFGGVTAFPKSSTLVTGLKYREKYAGHEARTTWPYNT